MERPKGIISFGYGDFKNLPMDVQEVKLYVRPGEGRIYMVPVDSIPITYEKFISKIDLEDIDEYEELI